MGATVRERVLAIYAAADAEVAAAAPRCDQSGRCCRFTEYGHTLFLSQLEADLLLADAPPFAGPVTRDGCPFQVGTLCTARDPRPLGCRVYFCDPAYAGVGERISETYVQALKELADEIGVGWRYAPLHTFLAEALASRERQRPESETPPVADAPGSPLRIPLPLTE